MSDLRQWVADVSNGRFLADTVDPEAHVLDAGYLDSFNWVQLLAHVETTYGVTIGDVQLLNDLTSLHRLARYIEEGRA